MIYRRNFMANGLLEYVGQIGGRVGGNNQGAPAFVGVAHGGGAGHTGFAYSPFAGEEDKLTAQD
jgi:hypothetical protein